MGIDAKRSLRRKDFNKKQECNGTYMQIHATYLQSYVQIFRHYFVQVSGQYDVSIACMSQYVQVSFARKVATRIDTDT